MACGYTVDEIKEIAVSFDFAGIAEETERATLILQVLSLLFFFLLYTRTDTDT